MINYLVVQLINGADIGHFEISAIGRRLHPQGRYTVCVQIHDLQAASSAWVLWNDVSAPPCVKYTILQKRYFELGN